MTSGLTAGPAVSTASETLRFVSLMSENAREFCALLVAYLADRVGLPCEMFDGSWQVGERELYAGASHVGIVCGLQYVLSVDRNDYPGVEVLAAPVMRGQRYGGQPVYFSDVVVRRESGVHTFADLRGAAWAYNEPTSHSGYNLARVALARRGELRAFFGRVVGSGSHLASLGLLLQGSVDATAIDTTVLEEELRVRPWLASEIRTIEPLGPSPIWPVVASRALPERTRSSLRAALLRMHLDPVDGGVYVAIGGCFGLIAPSQGNCGGLFWLGPGGSPRLMADLNAYEVQNHPDGTRRGESDPYAVLALAGERIVADAAANDVLRVGPNGQASLLAVFKQRMVPAPPSLNLPTGTLLPMGCVPDTLAVGRDGALYVGELTGFPFPIGGARIYRLVPGKAPQVFADGFTNIIDMAFDSDGSLLVLEIARNSLLSDDRTGALIRLNRDGSRTTLLSEGLDYPTAVAVHGDALYVSNCGTCPGSGAVLRISFGSSEKDGGDR